MGTLLSRPVVTDDSGRGVYRIRFPTTNPRRSKKRSTPSSPELHNVRPTTSPFLHPPTPAEPKSSIPKSTNPHSGRDLKGPLGVFKNAGAPSNTGPPGSTIPPHNNWHIWTRTQSEFLPKVVPPSFPGPTATPKPNVLFRGQGRLREIFRACFGPSGEYIALPASTQQSQESQTRQEMSLGVAFIGKTNRDNAPRGLGMARFCLGICIILVLVNAYQRNWGLLGTRRNRSKRRRNVIPRISGPTPYTGWENRIDFMPLFLSFVPDPPLPILPFPDPALLDLPFFAPRPRRPYRLSADIQARETKRARFLALIWVFLALQRDQASFRGRTIRRRNLAANDVLPGATAAFIEELSEGPERASDVGIRMISRCTGGHHYMPSRRHWGRDRVDVHELNKVLDGLLQGPAPKARRGKRVTFADEAQAEAQEDTQVEPISVDKVRTLEQMREKMALVRKVWNKPEVPKAQTAAEGPSQVSNSPSAPAQEVDPLLQERASKLKAKLAGVKRVLYGEKEDGAVKLYKKVLDALKAEKTLANDQLRRKKVGRSGIDSEQTTLCGDHEEKNGIFGYEKWKEMISFVNKLEKEVFIAEFDQEPAQSTPKVDASATGMKALRSFKSASGDSFYVHPSTLGSHSTAHTTPAPSAAMSPDRDLHCTSFEFELEIPGESSNTAAYPSIASRMTAMHKNPVHTVQMREQENLEKFEKDGLLEGMKEKGELWGMRELQRGRPAAVVEEEEILAALETPQQVQQPQAPRRNNSQTRGRRPGRRSRMGGWI